MQKVFSTEDIDPRERLDYWCDVAWKMIDGYDHTATGSSDFYANVEIGSLGPLGLLTARTAPCSIKRTKSKRAANDDVLILLQLGGTWTGRHPEGGTRLLPGDIVLVDPLDPYNVKIEPGFQQLIIKSPRNRLESRLGNSLRHLCMQSLRSNHTPVALLTSFMKRLPLAHRGLDKDAGHAIAGQILDLLAVAYFGDEHSGAATRTYLRMASRFRLKSTIETYLFDSRLKPSDFAKKAGMSIRHASSIIAADGTSLERYIFERRLERSREVLDNPTLDFRQVSEISHSHGFSNVSHFSRRFKQAFGLTPSEYRRRRAN